MSNQRLRLAILYSDGSIGVLRPDATRREAMEQRDIVDSGETDPAHRSGLATVDIAIKETLISQGEG
jgi:hypothetical protein